MSKKGQSWSEEEDKKLKTFVESMSCENCPNIYRPDCQCEIFKKKSTWEEIAKKMKTRTYGACQGRWNSSLDPHVCQQPWSKEEENFLLEIYNNKKYNTWVKRAIKLKDVSIKRRNGGDVASKYFELTKIQKKKKK